MKVTLQIPSAEVAKIASKFGIPVPSAVPFSVTLTLNVTEPNTHGPGDADIVSVAVIGVQ